jgi:hypothetical protein
MGKPSLQMQQRAMGARLGHTGQDQVTFTDIQSYDIFKIKA